MSGPVCIVGGGKASLPGYWQSAPEVWAVKHVGYALKAKGYQVDRIYWLDSIDGITVDWGNGTYEFLTQKNPNPEVPVVTVDPSPFIKNLIEFPLAEFVKTFGSDYINNSTVLAICHALWEKRPEIHFHGVDFQEDISKELTPQRLKDLTRAAQCVAYWLGRIDQAKFPVFRINPLSTLLDTREIARRGHKVRGTANSNLIMSLETTHKEKWKEVLEGIEERKALRVPIPTYEIVEPKKQ